MSSTDCSPVAQQSVRGLGVDARRRLVQHEHREAAEQRASQSDPLRLTAGHQRTAVAHPRIEPSALAHPRRESHTVEHGEEFFVGGGVPGEEEVLPHVLVEELRLLLAQADDAAQRRSGQRRRVEIADPVLAVHAEEAHERSRQRALARPTRPGDEHPLTRREVEVDPGQRRRPSGPVRRGSPQRERGDAVDRDVLPR
ncbi:unnamed protein product, partial [Penicillium discolor]